MRRPWRLYLAGRVERCCTCDRRIRIDDVVVDDGTCIVCLKCAGPVLGAIEPHGEESAA